MALQHITMDLPETIDPPKARFATAAGLIYQGAVSLKDALSIAGMERRAFIKAMVELGDAMAEAIEDAVDIEAIAEAREESKRLGLKPIPMEEVFRENGIKIEDLPSFKKAQKASKKNGQR